MIVECDLAPAVGILNKFCKSSLCLPKKAISQSFIVRAVAMVRERERMMHDGQP